MQRVLALFVLIYSLFFISLAASLAAGWLLPLCEKGEQFTLAIKLATFAYISDFLSHLSISVRFFHRLGQCAILTVPCICELFDHLCQSARGTVACISSKSQLVIFHEIVFWGMFNVFCKYMSIFAYHKLYPFQNHLLPDNYTPIQETDPKDFNVHIEAVFIEAFSRTHCPLY